jgi:hypothetical protein
MGKDSFFFRQEFGSSYAGRQDKRRYNAQDNSSESLENEDPAPASQTTYSIHFDDGSGKKTWGTNREAGAYQWIVSNKPPNAPESAAVNHGN